MSAAEALAILSTSSTSSSVSESSNRPSSSILDGNHVDCHTPIPEEYEDETSSEAVEPVTPTSDTHSHDFDHHKAGMLEPNGDAVHATVGTTKPKSLVVNTTSTPTLPKPLPASYPDPNASPSATTPSKRSTSTRIKSLFRRSTTHGASPQDEPKPGISAAATFHAPTAQEIPIAPARRQSSFSLSGWSSARTSKSNSPPSPGSPNLTMSAGPSQDGSMPKISRSSTGLQEQGVRIQFTDNLSVSGRDRQRSTSMTGLTLMVPDNSISMHAATGVGLKARRMSTELPDDFFVDAVELNSEFTSSSMVPGRRGKLVGSGATASVKLMARKGCPADQLYAVKEFRKRGKHETEEEYVKKVKSEYSIAKSLHHPNIVETIQLCIHNGRWNHVMEYCSQGELFTLVQKRYMEEPDRLCFFKQLLRGVAYLHAHGIAHRDIKLENLLITSNGNLKITDFGVSEVFCGEHPGLRSADGECGRNMKEERRCAPGICGSLPYIAPEVLQKKGEFALMSKKSALTVCAGDYDPRPLDVWSCAIVYMTMKFGGAPWPAAEKQYAQYAKFLRGWQTFVAKHPDQLITDESGTPKCGELFTFLESQAMRRLLLRMLNPVPEKRIRIHQALNDRWVKTIECCSLDSDGVAVGTVDVAGKKTCRLKNGGIQKLHNHLPPTRRLDALHPTF